MATFASFILSALLTLFRYKGETWTVSLSYRPFDFLSHFCLCFKTSTRAEPSRVWLTWKWTCRGNTFSYEWFCIKTRFDAEAEDNSEMAYCIGRLTVFCSLFFFLYSEILEVVTKTCKFYFKNDMVQFDNVRKCNSCNLDVISMGKPWRDWRRSVVNEFKI